MIWAKPPKTVLVLRRRPLESDGLAKVIKMVAWLTEVKKLMVFLEHKDLFDCILGKNGDVNADSKNVIRFVKGETDVVNKIDFIICLGGDSSLRRASSIFQTVVPPVMTFNIGLLNPFQFEQEFKNNVSKVMEGSPPVLLHFRLKCVLLSTDSPGTLPHVSKIQKKDSCVKVHKLVLNEVVLDRGHSSFPSNFDIYIEGRHVTSVQGDGLIISTPTGSTTYAVTAGASMAHPSVPCILITPICPQSLSFRPIFVPAGVEIKVKVMPDARGTSMVSFDGRDRVDISHEDILLVTTAPFPVPSICSVDQVEDWFDSLSACLNWNVRRTQRPLEPTTNGLQTV